MKAVYESPRMMVQPFVPDEYVAACGESGTTYFFKCDAGGGLPGNVYVESNNVAGLQPNREWIQTGNNFWEGYWQSADQSLGGYHACGTTHEADSQDDFLNGYYVPYRSGEVTDVIIWRGPHNNNVHCTTNLDQDSWETAKS